MLYRIVYKDSGEPWDDPMTWPQIAVEVQELRRAWGSACDVLEVVRVTPPRSLTQLTRIGQRAY